MNDIIKSGQSIQEIEHGITEQTNGKPDFTDFKRIRDIVNSKKSN